VTGIGDRLSLEHDCKSICSISGFCWVALRGPFGAPFRWFDVTPPNHPGYVQFPVALLLIFSIMFVAVAVNPVNNRNLIPYGILFKISYCGVVLFHWHTTDIPQMWKPFCIFDLVFLLLFASAWTTLRNGTARNALNA
jgi:hypothetical protein